LTERFNEFKEEAKVAFEGAQAQKSLAAEA